MPPSLTSVHDFLLSEFSLDDFCLRKIPKIIYLDDRIWLVTTGDFRNYFWAGTLYICRSKNWTAVITYYANDRELWDDNIIYIGYLPVHNVAEYHCSMRLSTAVKESFETTGSNWHNGLDIYIKWHDHKKKAMVTKT